MKLIVHRVPSRSPLGAAATCGTSQARRRRGNGFTLVEMLIALSIFGMLTAAAVTLLTLTARTQQTSDRLLAEVAELRRAGSLLGADLALAVPRLYRDADGRQQRAFAGGTGNAPTLLAFVRGGRDDGDGAAPQRVAYRLREGRLERVGYARLDGTREAVAVSVLEGVRGSRLRYRDEDGLWHERWDHSDGTRLPRAVELVTETATHGLVRQLFLVGTDGR